jgi:hypothetical protein
MKKLFLYFFAFAISKVYGQNEFAATAFYNDFKKIQADALEGFPKYKGSKKQVESSGLVNEYRIKLLLPLADSGRIFFPIVGSPYAEFYFQTAKTKEDIDQRAVNLREAVLTAYGKQLYTRTETSVIKQSIFSNTYYFARTDDSLSIVTVFKSSIYQDKEKYHLAFQIIGNPPKAMDTTDVPKSDLTEETDLNGKIDSFFNNAPNCFSSMKMAMTKSDEYYSTYDVNASLFGISGEIEESKLECTLKYSIGSDKLTGLDEAKSIYDKLKTSLMKVLYGKINFNAEEQSKYNAESYSIQGFDSGLDFIWTKNIVLLTIVRSEDAPAVYLNFNHKKY